MTYDPDYARAEIEKLAILAQRQIRAAKGHEANLRLLTMKLKGLGSYAQRELKKVRYNNLGEPVMCPECGSVFTK